MFRKTNAKSRFKGGLNFTNRRLFSFLNFTNHGPKNRPNHGSFIIPSSTWSHYLSFLNNHFARDLYSSDWPHGRNISILEVHGRHAYILFFMQEVKNSKKSTYSRTSTYGLLPKMATSTQRPGNFVLVINEFIYILNRNLSTTNTKFCPDGSLCVEVRLYNMTYLSFGSQINIELLFQSYSGRSRLFQRSPSRWRESSSSFFDWIATWLPLCMVYNVLVR